MPPKTRSLQGLYQISQHLLGRPSKAAICRFGWENTAKPGGSGSEVFRIYSYTRYGVLNDATNISS
jgi:hypothetical protein